MNILINYRIVVKATYGNDLVGLHNGCQRKIDLYLSMFKWSAYKGMESYL